MGDIEIQPADTCPYGCTDGRLFNISIGKWQPCPHCADKLKQISKGELLDKDGKDIYSILNIPKEFDDKGYNFEKVINDTDVLTPESVLRVNSKLREVYDKGVLGEAVRESVYFNLGKRYNIINYVFSFLCNCYKNGLTVSPYLDIPDIVELKSIADGINKDKTYEKTIGISYNSIKYSDICIVMIDAGVSLSGIYALKGLLNSRAKLGRGTIVFTHHLLSNMEKSILLTGENLGLDFLTPYEIEYTNSNIKEENLTENKRVTFNNSDNKNNSTENNEEDLDDISEFVRKQQKML